ncbi:U3 small nucleolar RNA-associated protein [Ceratobasidium theobromae]|uniref:U3 small nucleolar RNA-associated protein n=1 Tax=Ceratobasidium theobromae TaxID=1582974 RepID=A0A5N5QN88_9AGAM|nr:U3 small nucleolar RNA-associated protein [Ceratobasidium theobromae]
MSAPTLNKSRKEKRRRLKEQVSIPLGDNQATHEYQYKGEEELRLESVLFGTSRAGGSSDTAGSKGKKPVNTSMSHLLDDELFFNDSTPITGVFQAEQQAEEESRAAQSPVILPSPEVLSRKKAAWVDPDDSQLDVSIASDRRLRKLRNSTVEDVISGREYESRLRRQFEKINPIPEWAVSRSKRTRGSSQSSASGLDIDQDSVEEPTTGPIGISSTPLDALPPTELAITRLRDANQAARTDGAVTAIQFHPSARVPVLMVAGVDKRVRLFNVDGLTNPLLQTLHTPALPPNSATFHPSGTSILLSGPRPFVCVYDLQSAHVATHHVSGRAQPGAKIDTQDRACDVNAFSPDGRTLAIAARQGRVRLLDWATVSVVGEIKASAPVKCVWWGQNDVVSEMFTLDANAEICAWDARMRRCLRKWQDSGGFGTTIATEGASKYTAVGSKSGIVNVYDTPSTLLNSAPVPLKALPHLTTTVTSLRFNHDAQILASASKTKKDQFKLIHTKTLTTFANWPTSGTPLGHVTAMDFSVGSEYLAVGNTRGNVLLYNLRHYAVVR